MIIKAIKTPKGFFAVVALILLLVTTFVLSGRDVVAVNSNAMARKVPIYSVDRSDNKIAISFDCAYGADYTLSLLDTLDEYGVKCTFFCVEFWIKKFPDVAREIVKRGHEIGTHSKTHPKMSKLSKDGVIKELTSSISAIEKVTGTKVELFRPPFGDYNDNLLSVATSLKLYTIQWDVDSLDWKDISANEISSRIISKTKSGSIILCHNNAKNTPEALPVVLKTLIEKGYEFVKISELIYKEDYKINSFGKQEQTVK